MTNYTLIAEAAQIIKQGGLVSFPTETVYGIGANAFDEDACLKIYQVKGRPINNPLIIHVASLEQAKDLAIFTEDAIKLTTLWPGPLTMILPKKKSRIAKSVTANLKTIAIRFPAHPIAQELITQSNVPIAAPSANKSGRITSTRITHVQENFVNDDVFVLGSNEPTKYGIESTIIDLSTNNPTILRFGFITPVFIEKILNKKILIASKESPIKAPGMNYIHYAPKTAMRINVISLEKNEIGLNFGDSKLLATGSINLSHKGDLVEAAANLFNYLHILDHYAQNNNIARLAVAKVPNESIGLAINDRLSRAAQS